MPEKHTNEQGFNDLDFPLIPYSVDIPVSEILQQSLNRNMIWDSTAKKWRRQIGDTDGRIYVSTSPTQATSAVNSQVTVALVSISLLSANPSRKQYLISNLGGSDIFLMFGAAAVAATGFKLPSGGIFADDVFTGAINAICASGNADVRVVEM